MSINELAECLLSFWKSKRTNPVTYDIVENQVTVGLSFAQSAEALLLLEEAGKIDIQIVGLQTKVYIKE